MSLLIDALIILALLASVGYGVMLSNRLSKLMEILRDLEPAITAFSQAVDKSESSAVGLRSAAIKLAEEVGQAKGAAQRPSRAEAPARGRPGTPARPLAAEGEKSDMVRGFFNTLQARSGA